MSQVFVIRNHQGLYLSKQRLWLSGHDPQQLYRSAHRDEAINTVFEVTAKDLYLRAQAVECTLNEKGQPQVEPGDPALVQVEAEGDTQAPTETALEAPVTAPITESSQSAES